MIFIFIFDYFYRYHFHFSVTSYRYYFCLGLKIGKKLKNDFQKSEIVIFAFIPKLVHTARAYFLFSQFFIEGDQRNNEAKKGGPFHLAISPSAFCCSSRLHWSGGCHRTTISHQYSSPLFFSPKNPATSTRAVEHARTN